MVFNAVWLLTICHVAAETEEHRVPFGFVLIDLSQTFEWLPPWTELLSAFQRDVFKVCRHSLSKLLSLLHVTAGRQKGPLAERDLKSGMFSSRP